MNSIIIQPLNTEKGTNLRNKENKYIFKVSLDAEKLEIKKEIERIFGVKVFKVNTLHVKGKFKRVRSKLGKTSKWKKAVVSLKGEQKIELFGSV
ncbi:MAG: 50S ribosomal protein L23 [bacterium]